MNSRKSLYDIAEFYRKNAVLNASFQGMRYQIRRAVRTEDGEEQEYLAAAVWPEPFCYEKTAEAERLEREFSYTEESLDQIYEWLCEQYEQDQDRWEQGKNNLVW